MSDTNFRVKCVKPDNKEQLDGNLFEAFKSLKDHGFSPVCVTSDVCLEVEQKEKDCVYLMDPFDGRAFNHLSALGCRIFGPQCVLSCLLAKMEIPRRRVPIYNLAMKDVVLSCSNLAKETREEIHKKVELMCGEVSRVFTEVVTHLVIGEVGSAKYLVAAELGKHIMLPQWVDAVWQKSMYRHVHCLDEQFEKYKCPIFMGLVVTVSGLDSEERKEVKKIVEAEGGKYSGEMKLTETTHLVLKEAKGVKYEHAKKWKINIVRTSWLYESVEKGHCLDVKKYSIEKPGELLANISVKTSTPDRDKTTIDMSRLGDISTISNLSVIGGIADNNARSCQNQFSNGKGDNQLLGLDLSTAPTNLFLDGCKIYLSGFRSPALDKLKKLINVGGGTRFNSINENLTHVILGDRMEADVKLLKDKTFRPHVVTSFWLVQCFSEGRTVDEEPYKCLELSPPVETNSPVVKTKSKKAERSKGADVQQEKKKKEEEDMEEIMSQYLPQPDDTTLNNEKTNNEEDEDQTQAPSVNPDDTTLADEVDGDVDGVNQGIFYRKKIIFFGFDEEETKELVDYIVDRGGKVISENQRVIADYGVVPIVGYPVTSTVTEIVTNAWLQMCIEQDALLSIESNELFQPLELAQGIEEMQPLKHCVLSISGFTGTERDCLTHLVEILGARCQEYFVRKANKMLEASTHLIVREPGGTKYNTAIKWKLPALSKHWLFACAKTGTRIAESEYLIDKVFNKTSEETSNENQSSSNQPQCQIESTSDGTVKQTNGKSVQKTRDKTAKETKNNSDSKTRDNIVKETSDSVVKKTRNKAVKETKSCSDGETKDRSGSETSDNVFKETNDSAVRETRNSTVKETRNGTKETGNGTIKETKNSSIKKSSGNTSNESGEDSDKTSRHNASKESNSNAEHMDKTVKELGENNITKSNDNTSKELRSASVKCGGDGTSREGVSVENVAPGEERVVSSSAENSQSLQVDIQDPMADAKSLLKAKKLQDSQKENVVRTNTTPSSCKPQHSKIKELQQKKPTALGSPQLGVDSPSKFLAPGVKFLPNFNLTAAYAMLETPPEAKKHKRKDSASLTELFRDAINQMVKNTAVPWKDRTSDENFKPSSQIEDDRPLEGVVIAVSQKLSQQQAEYNDIVSDLGGSYSWNYTLSCTHYIFQGRANDKNKDFRNARDRGKIIVSPYWLYACKEEKRRIDESQFPHNYNPSLSLVVSTRNTPARSTRRTVKSSTKPADSERKARSWKDEKTSDENQIAEMKKLEFEDVNTEISPSTKTNVSPKATNVSPKATNVSSKASSNVSTKASSNFSPKASTNVSTKASSNISPKDNSNISPSERARRRSPVMCLNKQRATCTSSSSEDNHVSDQEKECVAPDVGSTLEIREVLSKQLETMMSSSGKKGSNSKRKAKRLDSSGQLNTSGNISDSGRSRPSSRQNRWNLKDDNNEDNGKRTRRSGSRSSDSVSAQEASQSVQVTWDDPIGRLEQRKLADQLEHANSPSQNTDDFIAAMDIPNDSFTTLDDEISIKKTDRSCKTRRSDRRSQEPRTPTPEAPPLAFPAPKSMKRVMSPQPVELLDEDSCDTTQVRKQLVFLVSGMQQAERVDYGALIEELGGRLLETQSFDQSCTHLIVEQPARNEKVLAAIASGKWVLHKSYFEACRQEHKFVKEENHEWGSEATSRIVKSFSNQTCKLAAAAHRWRQKVKELRKLNPDCKGAFDGWRVLLCSDKKRENNFRRLLEAGGAQVLSLKPPFTSDLSATHAFLELHKVSLSQEDLDHLVSGVSHCVVPDFIASYLTENPIPSADDFCPPAISALKASLPDKPATKRKKLSLTSSDTSAKRSCRH